MKTLPTWALVAIQVVLVSLVCVVVWLTPHEDHDEDDAGTGDNGGTTPPATQPGTAVGAPIAGTNGTEALIGTAAGETIMALGGDDNVVALF